MLTEILAILIAFIAIILLLSIVVTALVQTASAILQLRSRNLMKGLAGILANCREAEQNEHGRPKRGVRFQANWKKRSAVYGKAKKDAAKILNASNVALLGNVHNPTGFLHYWVLGPRVSWLDAEQLPKAATTARLKLSSETVDKLQDDFERSQPYLKKRFLRMTRGWTLAWALIVAAAFQISTPELLGELARDTERRDRIVADAEYALAHETEALERLNYDQVAPDALAQLADLHEEFREQIEAAIGVGTTREFLLEELELALETVPDRTRILQDYDQLLDQVAEQQFEEMSTELRAATRQLGRHGVGLWPKGLRYYYDESLGLQWDAIVGVLITMILLSLGAPFWYERMRDAILLRDVLAGGRSSSDSTNANEGQSGNPPRVVLEVRSSEINAPSDADDDIPHEPRDSAPQPRG